MNAITIKTQSEIEQHTDIADLVHDWQLHLELQERAGEISPNTRGAYIRGWARFSAWLAAEQIGAVDSDTVRDWVASMREAGNTPNSINVWLAGVRSFFGWAVGARRLAINPTMGVKSARRKGTARTHLRDILTDEEMRRVLAQPDRATARGKRDYAILALKAYTGARDIELNRANLSDLRTQGGELVLYVTGKGRESADEFVVLPPEAERAVYDWLAIRGGLPGALFTATGNRSGGKRLSLRAIRGMVKDCYRAVGVRGERKTSHSMRHTAITNAIRNGAPIQKVKSMARHASIDTTMIYYHEMDRIADPAENYISYERSNV